MNDHRGLVVLVQSILTLIAVLLLASYWDDAGFNPDAFIWRMAAAYTAQAVWAFSSWRLLTRRWADAYTLFLLALVLFSGGQLILHTFGLLPNGILGRDFRAPTLQRTLLLVNASLVAFHLGAVLRCARQRPGGDVSQQGQPAVCDSGIFRWMGYAFLVAALPITVMQTIDSVEVVASSGYFGLYQQQAHTGFAHWRSVLAGFFLPGLLIVLATRPRSWLNVQLCWMLAIGRIGANVFYGARAAAAITLVPMLMLHHLVVRRIRPSVALAIGIGGLVVSPIIAQLREMDLRERIVATRTGVVQRQPVGTAAVGEMGGSMGIVAHTIELVPTKRPFDHGMGYVRAASTAFPNLFWDVHPAVSGGTYSDWLIEEVDPVAFEAGGGLGFSMIAEAYLNFSRWGSLVVMLVAGYLLSAFVVWTRRGGSSVHYILEALVLSALLFLPRAESTTSVRTIVWTAALPYLVVRLAQRGRTRVVATAGENA